MRVLRGGKAASFTPPPHERYQLADYRDQTSSRTHFPESHLSLTHIFAAQAARRLATIAYRTRSRSDQHRAIMLNNFSLYRSNLRASVDHITGSNKGRWLDKSRRCESNVTREVWRQSSKTNSHTSLLYSQASNTRAD